MRKILIAAALLLTASGAAAQSVAELRAQLQQTRQMIAEAEAAGADAALLGSLHEAMEMAEEAIREMEAEQNLPSTAAPETAPAAPAAYTKRLNALIGEKACEGITMANYQTEGLGGGNDVQLKTMCAQAHHYYAMYENAIAKGFSEADANITYDAHAKAALNAVSFYANNRAE